MNDRIIRNQPADIFGGQNNPNLQHVVRGRGRRTVNVRRAATRGRGRGGCNQRVVDPSNQLTPVAAKNLVKLSVPYFFECQLLLF